MKLGPLLGGIVAAAALIFAVLWWRASQAPVDGAVPGATSGVPESASAPAARAGESARAVATAPSGASSVVPVAQMARSELRSLFGTLKIPPAVMDALVAGRSDEAKKLLEASNEPDSIVALAQLPAICAASIGSTMLEAADVRRFAQGEVSPERVSALERTVAAQREWATRFLQGCHAAGLRTEAGGVSRDPEFRGRVLNRLRRCADAGNANCLSRLAILDSSDPAKQLQRLQAASLLGSTEAQERLLVAIESGPRAEAPESVQAARVWREALAKANPEYRATFLGCYEKTCDPAQFDRAQVRRELEAAARDGSLTALTRLAVTERNVAEAAAEDGANVDATSLPLANPSEPDAYAWRAVTERLAMQGCLGFWPTWASFVGGTAAAARELRPSQLDEAKRLADRYWDDYGRSIASRRDCADDASR